jgi:hypothetical protein
MLQEVNNSLAVLSASALDVQKYISSSMGSIYVIHDLEMPCDASSSAAALLQHGHKGIHSVKPQNGNNN